MKNIFTSKKELTINDILNYTTPIKLTDGIFYENYTTPIKLTDSIFYENGFNENEVIESLTNSIEILANEIKSIDSISRNDKHNLYFYLSIVVNTINELYNGMQYLIVCEKLPSMKKVLDK